MVRIGFVVFKKVKNVKLLTDDAKITSHDDGRRPIAIGHPSDSGVRKKEM